MEDLFILYSIPDDYGQLAIEGMKCLTSRNAIYLLGHNSLRY
jgi:hypothetical protein